MKRNTILAMALASVMTVSALAPSAFAAASTDSGNTETTVQETVKKQRHGKRHSETAEPENAIGKDAAKEKALADAGLTAEQAGKVKARVSQTEDGTIIYKVHFTVDGQRYSYQIDAASGAVLSKKDEPVTEDAASGHSRGGKHGKKAEAKAGAKAGAEADTTAV